MADYASTHTDLQHFKILLSALEQGSYHYKVRALKITESNARCPVDFSNASIFFEREQSPPFALGTLFRKAHKILSDYIKSPNRNCPTIPEDPDCRKALDLLLKFLQNIDKVSESLTDVSSSGGEECRWILKLAQHVFSQLSLNPKYKYDVSEEYSATRCQCPGKDTIIGDKCDISFGLENGWHGKADIIMTDVPVCEVSCSTDVSEGRSTPSERPSSIFGSETESNRSIELISDEKFSYHNYSQIAAETITFSFLRNKTAKNEVTLVPSIAVNKRRIQVHFYDSVNDVFLQSGIVPLTDPGDPKSTRLNTFAVFLIWLVLNHNLFCTGVEKIMKKSGFHSLVDVDIFNNEVKAPCNLEKISCQKWLSDEEWPDSVSVIMM